MQGKRKESKRLFTLKIFFKDGRHDKLLRGTLLLTPAFLPTAPHSSSLPSPSPSPVSRGHSISPIDLSLAFLTWHKGCGIIVSLVFQILWVCTLSKAEENKTSRSPPTSDHSLLLSLSPVVPLQIVLWPQRTGLLIFSSDHEGPSAFPIPPSSSHNVPGFSAAVFPTCCLRHWTVLCLWGRKPQCCIWISTWSALSKYWRTQEDVWSPCQPMDRVIS